MTREEMIARAEELGLKFPKNIGDDKLAAKIAEAEDAEKTKPPANGTTKDAGTTNAPATKPKKAKKPDAADLEDTYTAAFTIRHNGETYEAGEELALTGREAAPLVASGALTAFDV